MKQYKPIEVIIKYFETQDVLTTSGMEDLDVVKNGQGTGFNIGWIVD